MQILVLGTHRSGTSAVARLVNMLGAYYAPKGLELAPQSDNPKGFWERRDVVELNDEILRVANGSWDDVADLNLELMDGDLKEAFAENVKSIIRELNEHRHWMLKDPRMCLTLPVWRPCLDNPVCVYVYRNPIQVAKSLARRNGFSMHFSLALWEYYTVSALNAARGIPKVMVRYEELMEHPVSVVKKLCSELTILSNDSLEMAAESEITGFLDSRLFHEKTAAEDLYNYLSLSQAKLCELFENGQINGNEDTAFCVSSSSLEVLRYGQLQVDLNQKMEEFKYADNTVKELEGVINNILSSRQWIFSSKLLRLIRGARKKESIREYVDRILMDYHLFFGQPARDSSQNTKTKFGVFRDLLGAAVKNPLQVLALLNVSRIKHLYKLLFNESEFFASEVVGNSLKAYGLASADVYEKTLDFAKPDKISVPYFGNPLVSIIIPVYNNYDMTMTCLYSIVQNTQGVEYEIIIGDDCSEDETNKIGLYVKNLRIVRSSENLGFLQNCNNAASKARGDYLVFLNNDTYVLRGWLSELVSVVENDPSVGCVGSKLLFGDGRLQEAGGIIWEDASGWNYGRGDDSEKPEYNYLKDVDYVSGACLLTRRSLWIDIGGFDKRFCPAYYEDTDYSFAVRDAGYRVVYQPKSVVFHFEGGSHGTDESSGIKQHQHTNQKKFFEKWGSVLQEKHFKNGEGVFRARDRSFDKKTIVVIDHYISHFDKDAGSRHTYQYLKWFVEMGMNVKFIGDNYYRYEPYTTTLQQLGIEVLYGPIYAKGWKKWFKREEKNIDYIYLHRPHIAHKYVGFLKSLKNPKLFFFGHDLHYLRLDRQALVENDNRLKKEAERWRRKEYSLFEKVDVVYYPSFVEVEEIRNNHQDLNVKAIPLYIFDHVNPIDIDLDSRRDLLFVGGFGHAPNVDAVQWFVADIFPRIINKNKTIRLVVVGSNMPNTIKGLASDNIIIAGEVTDDELAMLYRQIRVVVVPLRYGAGIKGKVLEAMQSQVPVVTTSIGAEGLPDADTYLSIVDTEDGFAKEVLEIYSRTDLWRGLSEAGRLAINKYFNRDAVHDVFKLDMEFK